MLPHFLFPFFVFPFWSRLFALTLVDCDLLLLMLSNANMEPKQNVMRTGTQSDLSHGRDCSKSAENNSAERHPPEMGIDPENEAKGIKLFLIDNRI